MLTDNRSATPADSRRVEDDPAFFLGRVKPWGVVAIFDADTHLVLGLARGLSAFPELELGEPLPEVFMQEAGEHLIRRDGLLFNIRFFPAGDFEGMEIEQVRASTDEILRWKKETAAVVAAMANAETIQDVGDFLARSLQKLLDFERVSIQAAVDGDMNEVFAEVCTGTLPAMLHQRFPSSNLPDNVRRVLMRNPCRIIQDARAATIPIICLDGLEAREIDLAECSLRPIPQFYRNFMDSEDLASLASFTLTAQDKYWGIASCHDSRPRHVSPIQRQLALRISMAAMRQIQALQNNDDTFEFGRLRARADAILLEHSDVGSFTPEGLSRWLSIFSADEIHVIYGDFRIWSGGRESSDCFSLRLEKFLKSVAFQESDIFVTTKLSNSIIMNLEEMAQYAGLLAIRMEIDEPLIVCAFRREQPRTVVLARPLGSTPDDLYDPRREGRPLHEELRFSSRPWTAAQIRIGRIVLREIVIEWQNQTLTARNCELAGALDQIKMLSDEMHHRVKNSLQLIASFLSAQMRTVADSEARDALAAARSRVMAIGLIQRRLYARDGETSIRLDNYLHELVLDILSTLDPEWEQQISVDLDPVVMANEKAMQIGLVLNEIITNTAKHAYGGEPGPISVTLRARFGRLVLQVSDQGRGKEEVVGEGFGSQIIQAFCEQLEARLKTGRGPNGRGYASRLNLAL